MRHTSSCWHSQPPYCWPRLHPPLQSFLFSHSNKKKMELVHLFSLHFLLPIFPPKVLLQKGDIYILPTHLSAATFPQVPLDIKEWQNSPNRWSYKLVQKFKGSILGADIGIKSGGFSNVAILATIIAIGAICIMYFSWRF